MPLKSKRNRLLQKVLSSSAILWLWVWPLPSPAVPFLPKGVEEAVVRRLQPALKKAEVPFPPKAVRVAVFKRERKVELWLPDQHGRWRYTKTWDFTATSGKIGPRLYYGDLQIPEGIYRIDLLTPSKEYYLALHLNYPNEFDRAMLLLDGRDPDFVSTGIYIHGGNVSYGCVVIGDRNIEELFLLVSYAGMHNTEVFIFPHDSDRQNPKFERCSHCPVWYGELQRLLEPALRKFQKP
ncbi:MAG: hypothetical protein N2Z22_01380 [Turneriella sp.]|nr:hypothetical protein [Turneriella sp.]